tara:strand:+ start:49 stop:1749 length:1701 start_codon:yes stop_codon:yes gene_type:complete
MNIFYRKNENDELFSQFLNNNILTNMQNYIPIYNKIFNLNEKNYNTINLNSKYCINYIKQQISDNKFKVSVKDISDNIIEKNIFIKYSPIVDPCKYMLGKYDNSYNILTLPSFNNNDISLNNKINDINNASYIDGFFSYLSSLLLHKYNIINGLDFYGSFICVKNDFICNIEDDIEYIRDSSFFYNNIDTLFKFIDEKYLGVFNSSRSNKRVLKISNYLDISLNNVMELCDISSCILETNDTLNSNDIEYIDLSFNKKNTHNSNNNSDNESLSSRVSHTNSEKSNSNDSNDSNETDNDELDNISSNSSSKEEDDENILIKIHKFPTQTIILECCDTTLDKYILSKNIPDNEWEAIMLQIIFTLIIYQKTFEFTHNDLHTNNIMYNTTEKKFIYYRYKNRHYKVPTYGKIYKIIDFGRAIYKLKGDIYCSDSYSQDGDAATQYNCEPYFNDNKPRVDPNYSFDLCRLGCSLFDYFIDELEDIKKIKSPIKKLLINLVYDDNGKNILYKNNGEERYPDFKLYKMIARTVHNHEPCKILSNNIFDKYLISKKKINSDNIINIDNLPILS